MDRLDPKLLCCGLLSCCNSLKSCKDVARWSRSHCHHWLDIAQHPFSPHGLTLDSSGFDDSHTARDHATSTLVELPNRDYGHQSGGCSSSRLQRTRATSTRAHHRVLWYYVEWETKERFVRADFPQCPIWPANGISRPPSSTSTRARHLW